MDAATADLSALSKDFAAAGRNASQKMDTWMQTVGLKIEQEMKSRAPVRTGRLRNSIRMTTAPGRVQIGPVDVLYDVYQEYGTRRMRAHPFARPAFTDVMNDAVPDATAIGVQLIVAP